MGSLSRSLCLLLLVAGGLVGCSSDTGATEDRYEDRERLVNEDGGGGEEQALKEDGPAEDSGGMSDRQDGDLDKKAWGFVAVIKQDPRVCGSATKHSEWCSPVRGYFATQPNHTRVLPHHMDAICRKQEIQNEAGCVLNTNCNGFQAGLVSCDGICGNDEECVDIECIPFPPHWDVGTLTVRGLNVTAQLSPDELDRYELKQVSTTLFEPGSQIRAEVSGGELGAFSLQSRGVQDLVIPNNNVLLSAGKPATIAWKPSNPPDPEAKIQVLIYAGWHFPLTPNLMLVCEAPDSAGKIQIPAAMVDRLQRSEVFMRPARITRFTRDVQTPFHLPIELFVGHALELFVSKE